jgi:hypothetical protein
VIRNRSATVYRVHGDMPTDCRPVCIQYVCNMMSGLRVDDEEITSGISVTILYPVLHNYFTVSEPVCRGHINVKYFIGSLRNDNLA